MDNLSVAEVTVGTEFEFYCIAENAKGKMSDRAVGIRYLKRGSVQMEYLLAEQVLATVVQEPRMHPQEEPGILLLQSPLDLPIQIRSKLGSRGTSKEETEMETLKEIELWQRCCPDNLIFRCGDTIKINVHYYRPEKLFFSRDVKVEAFRLLGRESGKVLTLKQGYGFLSLGTKFASSDTTTGSYKRWTAYQPQRMCVNRGKSLRISAQTRWWISRAESCRSTTSGLVCH